MSKSKKEKTKENLNINCIDKNTIYKFEYTNFFLKAVKKHLKTAKDKKILCDAIKKLSINGDLLEPKYKAHNLKGDLKEFREAHLKYDLLLVWQIEENTIYLTMLGTHSELFE